MTSKEKIRKYTKTSGYVLAELLVVVFLLLAIAASALSWRLLSGPLDIDFAKPYIQEALRDRQTGVYAHMDKVVLYWPSVSEPVLLGLQGAALYRPDGSILAATEEAALGLSGTQLILGRVRPEALILRRPSLSVTRNLDNSFEVNVADLDTYGPKPRAPKPSAEGDFIEAIVKILALGDKNPEFKSSPLAVLKSFEVEDASILVDDRVLEFSWIMPRADVVLERDGDVLNGVLKVGGVDPRYSGLQAPEGLEVRATLDPVLKLVDIDALLQNFDISILGQKIPELSLLTKQTVNLSARLQAKIGLDMALRQARVTALSEQGSLQIAEWSAEPVAYKNFGLVAKYDADAQSFDVPRVQIDVGDVPVVGSLGLRLGEDNMQGSARVQIQSVSQAAIVPLWPVALAEDSAKDWVVDRLSEGTFSNAYAQGIFSASKVTDDPSEDIFEYPEFVFNEYENVLSDWHFEIEDIIAGFDFEGMKVDYRAPLAAVTNAKGKGVFNYKDDTLRIDIETAKLLDLSVPKADVLVTHVVAEGVGDAEINVDLKGPVKSVLDYVRAEPLEVETDIDIANTQGDATLSVNIKLPTQDDVKIEDVKVSAQGQMNAVKIPGVVHGLTLSDGPYDVTIKDNLLNVEGKGFLEDEAIDVEYSEYLVSAGAPFSSKVKASLMASPKLRAAFGIDLSAFLEGPGFVDVLYTKTTDGRGQADVQADLTSSRLFVEPFGYEKPPGQKAEVSLLAVLNNDSLVEIRDLKGSAPSLTLEPSTLKFRQDNGEDVLAGGAIPRFTLNETVASLDFDVAADGLTQITLKGPFLDARPFLADDEEEDADAVYDSPPMRISVAADTMRTADEQTVQYAKIYMDINAEGKFNQLELDAIAGSGDLNLRFKPDETGKRVFRMQAADAGATLRAFDLYEDIIGGTLTIYAEPQGWVLDRNLKGKAEMANFKVVRAPVLARLLGVMSLTGVTELLNQDGLSFSKLDADFDWMYRPEGSLLVLKNGRTSGNSLGLTFDGQFDNAAKTLDVSGTIIPLSGVNKIIGDIPLVGDILTGGTGSLIAATYKLQGPSADPQTSVNPLSVLAPGILRRILFEQN